LWNDALQQKLLGKVLIKPKYGHYAMKQAVLFECYDKMQGTIYQAGMAEHVFSRVAHSYVHIGGFNSISGGTSITSARDLPDEAYNAQIAVTNHKAILLRIEAQITAAQQELADEMTIKDGQKLRAKVKKLKDAYDDGEIALAASVEKLRDMTALFDDEFAEKWSAAKRFALFIQEQHVLNEKVDAVLALMEKMVETVKQFAAMNAERES